MAKNFVDQSTSQEGHYIYSADKRAYFHLYPNGSVGVIRPVYRDSDAKCGMFDGYEGSLNGVIVFSNVIDFREASAMMDKNEAHAAEALDKLRARRLAQDDLLALKKITQDREARRESAYEVYEKAKTELEYSILWADAYKTAVYLMTEMDACQLNIEAKLEILVKAIVGRDHVIRNLEKKIAGLTAKLH